MQGKAQGGKSPGTGSGVCPTTGGAWAEQAGRPPGRGGQGEAVQLTRTQRAGQARPSAAGNADSPGAYTSLYGPGNGRRFTSISE